MSFEEIPTIRVNLHDNDFKKQQIENLCKGYNDIIGRSVNANTMNEIFYYIRMFNRYQISPLLFFSYCITAQPKDEYVRGHQLKLLSSNILVTMPVSMIDLVEYTINNMGYIPRIVDIEFDPLEIEWETIEEYEAIMNIFIDNGLDDIRYRWFLTIQFY